MLLDPLHPAVVHFPLVLAFLAPLVAVGALWAIRRGTRTRSAWAVPLALSAGLMGSAWFAVETGEDQEDRVEDVVAEEAIHEHEEAAERFLVLSGVLLLVSAGGLLGGTLGSASRYVATIGTLVMIVAAVQVGDAGGRLVYEHGAAGAYTRDATNRPGATLPSRPSEREEDEAYGN